MLVNRQLLIKVKTWIIYAHQKVQLSLFFLPPCETRFCKVWLPHYTVQSILNVLFSSVNLYTHNLRPFGSLMHPFPHSHQHARWPVDVLQLLDRFCCWTPIWLDAPLSLTRRGYWRYRNLFDWLIDWLWHSGAKKSISDPDDIIRNQILWHNCIIITFALQS